MDNDWTWGVDSSTTEVSIGMVHRPTLAVDAISIPVADKDPGRRLAGAYEAVLAEIRDTQIHTGLASVRPPVAVWVEQPSGRFKNLPLTYMVGVLQAALYAGLKDAFPYPVTVYTVPPAQWKQEVLGPGKGNANKAATGAWARSVGYEGDSEHEADAIGMAMAGLRWIKAKQ